jgi:hypothetical protein
LIREAIVDRNIIVRVLVLNPELEKIVSYKERIFGLDKTNKSLQQRIKESLLALCNLKAEFGLEQKNNLIIQTYSSDIPYSMIIIDHGTDNACIKVEQHALESEEFARQNRLVFRKDSQQWYNEYYRKYEGLSIDSKVTCND